MRPLLRRIALLERELEIWPPWHFAARSWYDMAGGAGYEYVLPGPDELEERPRWR